MFMIIGTQRNHEIYQAAIWVGGEPLNRSASDWFVGFRSSPIQVVKCSIEFLQFVELIRMAIDYEHMHKIRVHIHKGCCYDKHGSKHQHEISNGWGSRTQGIYQRNRREWVGYWFVWLKEFSVSLENFFFDIYFIKRQFARKQKK